MWKVLFILPLFCFFACGKEEKDKKKEPPITAPVEKNPENNGPGSNFPFPLPGGNFPLPIPGGGNFPFPIPVPPIPIPGTGGNSQGSGNEGGDNKTPDSATSKSLLDAVNEARAARGLSQIAYDSKLGCAADRHAKDIGPKHICGHTGSDGSSPWARAEGCGTSANGEIVACGQGSPKAAVDAWTLSPGHAAIMYDASQKAFGGAMIDNYWVVIFRK